MTSTDSGTPAPVPSENSAPPTARGGRSGKVAKKRTPGGFIVDKETIYPGLIIFRRADVQHQQWYCRVKLPKAERYKTVALKTTDAATARQLAMKQENRVQFSLENDMPVFNRPFLSVAREYLATQEERASRHEIGEGRVQKMRSIIEQVLNDYVGTTQVSRIGQETWDGYPAWRRATGRGRNLRNGAREVSGELADALLDKETAARQRARVARGLHPTKRAGEPNAPVIPKLVPMISDSTIRFEMSIFGAVMNYAIKKKYAPASQRFDERPKLKVMRRDAFSAEEYRHLHTVARKWMVAQNDKGHARKASSLWYRTVAYNFVLIMCNTGMRPSEAKNLRWGDITPAKDKDGREIAVLYVQGKGKSRNLVAPPSVLDYLNRIRAIARTPSPAQTDADGKPALVVGNPGHKDFVFTTYTGEPASSLYQALIEDLLITAKLRDGDNGIPRSTYCFRHTYATFRLSEGVDVYFLAEQMGTSVKMIEDHYGHVNNIRHADRVLQGMGRWEGASTLLAEEGAAEVETTKPSGKATKRKASKPATAKQATTNAAHAAAARTRTTAARPKR
jgi:integrase